MYGTLLQQLDSTGKNEKKIRKLIFLSTKQYITSLLFYPYSNLRNNNFSSATTMYASSKKLILFNIRFFILCYRLVLPIDPQ